ncbi:MAG: FkbM family methyltransferase [Flavobacteriales bacterium]|nr:FkbM family methyltransferase [Flavobacteriales bacterium]MBK7941457.1 FkbM family methyltransferase [Flavobacteriales bacterium]MBK8949119.1 FkbM family methyltransferase [Flavobacteriales bacterium]MBK9701447.1 FkbM family methyltransferase [Flavobacteriales bacterium]
MWRTPLRTITRQLTRLPVRGRHRLADLVGEWTNTGEPIEIVRNGVRLSLDLGIRQHRMMFFGLYEVNIMNFLSRTLRPGMVVFDPGANMGYFAAHCLGLVGPQGHVHSFEPSRTANTRIRELNDLGTFRTWSLWDLALTDHTGTHTFYDTPRVMVRGFACLEGTFDPKDKIPYPVHVTTVDAFCAEQGIDQIDFLKLDIEGSELPALRGCQHMLAEGRVARIMVETTLLDRSQAEVQAMDDLLRGAGFRSYRALTDGRTVPVDVMAHRELREDILWLREG